MTADLIETRPEESFDVEAVASFLAEKVEGLNGIPTVRQFAGGHANLTYLLEYPRTELVLRRPPLGPVAPGSHDMEREYNVLSRLYQIFPPAPRAFAYCPDDSLIGSPFFVMERKGGVVIRGKVPDVFGGGSDPVANAKLSEVVIDTLAAFHRADPTECGLDTIGRPDGFIQRQVQGWMQRWEGARHEENETADRVASWIAARIPHSPSPTLLHNDWRLDNMAVAPEDPGRCLAVYDWDMCTRGDPLADLGTLMAVWYEGDEVPANLNPMPTRVPGFMTRAEAVARYHALTGISVDDFGWYLVFGTWKVGVVLQQIFIRWHRGQTHDERFASMGDGARRLFELAAARI